MGRRIQPSLVRWWQMIWTSKNIWYCGGGGISPKGWCWPTRGCGWQWSPLKIYFKRKTIGRGSIKGSGIWIVFVTKMAWNVHEDDERQVRVNAMDSSLVSYCEKLINMALAAVCMKFSVCSEKCTPLRYSREEVLYKLTGLEADIVQYMKTISDRSPEGFTMKFKEVAQGLGRLSQSISTRRPRISMTGRLQCHSSFWRSKWDLYMNHLIIWPARDCLWGYFI